MEKKVNTATNFIVILMVAGGLSMAQKTHQVTPPQLKTRQTPGVNLYAGFGQKLDSATVVTVKFKLTQTGFLDTLYVSENAPKDYYEKIRNQLKEFDGKWVPQQSQGHPEKSKWLIYRHYVVGPYSRKGGVWAEVERAYQRDYDLFRCQHNPKRQIQCLTTYIEGPDFFLFPPEWYPTYN
ncbi:hypothetical protein [Fibrisoma montanum]|nr:hypothetical protein [Fibrisoma montanum]